MPLVLYFKQPNISLIVKGELDSKRKKALTQTLGQLLEFESIEGNHRIHLYQHHD